MNRSQIEGEIRAFIGEGCDDKNDARFDYLARELFQFQFENSAFYRKFAEHEKRTLDQVKTWRAVPFLPVIAFKSAYVASFPKEKARYVFRTSGTTESRKGELFLDSLAVYELSVSKAFKYFCLPDLGKVTMASLIPSFSCAADSSLSCMISTVFSAYGTPQSAWFFEGAKPDWAGLSEFLRKAAQKAEPVMLFGTTLGFLDFLDYCGRKKMRFNLPRRSRIMETGGSKGKRRRISKADLYRQFESTLGVNPVYCINEYGMTEMGSQFYDSTLRDQLFGHDGEVEKLGPPWARTRVIDPMTGSDVEVGCEGILCHIDLSNIGSALALETEDLGIRMQRGFEIIDRIPAGESRGCSLADEERIFA
ncbi:MAG: hypothetical protein HY587_01570 [Candidatus Omnitrophica bacterium]|nr:hypothetical protein [Candidatus Omnitrophota bacterium]